MPRSRTRTGRWSAPRSGCHGRIGCGTSRSRISGTASPAAPASATTLPASLGAALANKKHGRFTRRVRRRRRLHVQSRARCGRPPITRFRCSTSCRTTAPIIRNTCIWWPWRRGTAAASSKHGYRHHAQGPEYRLRHRGARHGRLWRRTDHRPEGPCAGARARRRRRQDAASRRWSTSSPTRAEEICDEILQAHRGHGVCGGRRSALAARRLLQAPGRSARAMPRTASASFSPTAASPATAAPGRAAPITARRRSLPTPRCRSTALKASCAIPPTTCRPIQRGRAVGPGYRRHLRLRGIAAGRALGEGYSDSE